MFRLFGNSSLRKIKLGAVVADPNCSRYHGQLRLYILFGNASFCCVRE
jgi:hypothetical protein